MSSLNYTTYINQISNLLVIASTDSSFTTMLPGMIDYAEQRIYRELDLLATRVTDATASLSAGERNFNLPTDQGTYIVVEEVNVITPASESADTGTRIPLTYVSRPFLDTCYPTNSSGTNTPIFFTMNDDTSIIVGPTPDGNYNLEITGTQRPTSLSTGNSSTFLTSNLPDLFIAASMVFGSGYQRDFSAQGDNPQQAQSWENQYQLLKNSANVEEIRKKYYSQGWTSKQPSPLASPPRV